MGAPTGPACTAQQGHRSHRQQVSPHCLGGVVQRQRLSTAIIADDRGSLIGRGKDAALGKHRTLSTFPPPRWRSLVRATFHQGLLRREEDEKTVQRRVGKPAGENVSLVTERF